MFDSRRNETLQERIYASYTSQVAEFFFCKFQEKKTGFFNSVLLH